LENPISNYHRTSSGPLSSYEISSESDGGQLESGDDYDHEDNHILNNQNEHEDQVNELCSSSIPKPSNNNKNPKSKAQIKKEVLEELHKMVPFPIPLAPEHAYNSPIGIPI
jgi:hypothetical protein